MNGRLRTLLAAAPALALLSCAAPTKFISAGAPPGQGPRTMRSVLVVGVSEIREGRQRFENDFAAALRACGVKAFPSYALFPCCAPPGADDIRAAATERGIDTVLVTRLIDVREDAAFSPRSYGPYAGEWWYYGFSREGVYMAGYEANLPPAVLETVLCDASGGDLEWRAVSRTVNEGGSPAQIRSLVKNTVGKMREDGLMQ